MADLVGDAVRDIPYYGLMAAKVGGEIVLFPKQVLLGKRI